ncbi:occludin/ELL domain-containing protein 1 [Elgaria multicarinata webbii]|uniref:occludin/ELL domain-containing protein 1 n=1 Tax=Elgaria multicarinata webbii TaxID=159646 RepID=UPI002FCCF265
MAAEDTPASFREKRQPMAGENGDLLSASIQLQPMERWAKDSENSLGSSYSGGSHSSPRGFFPSASSNIPQDQEMPALKPVRRFIPPSWKNFFRPWWRQSRMEPFLLTSSPKGVEHSPPASPVLDHPRRTIFGCDGSSGSDNSDSGEDYKKPFSASITPLKPGKMLTATSQGDFSTTPPSYKEKLEAYDHKYAYMKSWPGLLRLMGGLELILGGMVFACTAAYIQKDYQWSQLYGGNILPYNGITGGGYGYNYYGPMTPFVLVVASLVWLVTVILLGLGVTMYYRTILLDSHWWPLTEFALNLIMFLLYMAAAIAYVNDVNRGGLCYSVFAANPLIVALCRIEGGQVAAIAFLFITMLLYLVGSLVCLKMWRHETARKHMQALPKPIVLRVGPHQASTQDDAHPAGKITKRVEFSEKGEEPEVLNLSIPTGHHPKPHIVPDYLIKYPAIGSPEEREKYKAVFNDQYAEYKELHSEVRAARRKFQHLDTMMSKLPRRYHNEKEQSRFSAVWKEYKTKKKEPAYLEKQERCDYLKRKLAHLKAQIQAYDRECGEGSIYF